MGVAVGARVPLQVGEGAAGSKEVVDDCREHLDGRRCPKDHLKGVLVLFPVLVVRLLGAVEVVRVEDTLDVAERPRWGRAEAVKLQELVVLCFAC